MNQRTTLLTIFFKTNVIVLILFFSGKLLAQQTGVIIDNPAVRAEFELLKTKNPTTGKIPDGIRLKELAFAKTSQQGISPTLVGDIYQDWKNRGPHNVGGRTRALALDVNNENILLAGGVSGGMWRSTDQGISWIKTTGSSDLQSVTAIAQDTRSGYTNTWYYGTGEIRGNSASGFSGYSTYGGDGIYKSTDNGQTWTLLPSTSTGIPQIIDQDFDFNHEIVVNPINGDVYAANYGGVYKSSDGGVSWLQVLSDFQSKSDILITTTGDIYAFLDETGIYQSNDNGNSWLNITPVDFPLAAFERKEMAVAPSNENIIYIIGEASGYNSIEHTLWKYNNGNGDWTDLSNNLPPTFWSQDGYNLLVKIKPDDENFVIIGDINLWRSTDGFSSTTNTTQIGGYGSEYWGMYPNHHPDQHALIFLPSNNRIVVSGNDGGVQITNDITANYPVNEPVEWIPLNNGYLTTQVYAVSTGPGNQLMAGFQDNSTWLTTSTNPKTEWSVQYGGDGGYNAFNSTGTARYVSTQFGNAYRLTYDDANDITSNNEVNITPIGYDPFFFIPPIYLDPENDDLIYFGGEEELWVNTQASTADRTAGWKTINLGNWGDISEIGTTHHNRVYVGTVYGKLFKIDNPSGTETVTDIAIGAPFNSYYTSGIGVNPINPDEVIVCFSNYSIPSIFHSSDGGVSWTDVSGNLEEFPDGTGNGPSVRSTRILGNGYRYFVGTSTGLYSTATLNGASTIWIQESPTDIGNVVVEHLDTREIDGQVVAGTHGNGIFSAKYEVPGLPTTELGLVDIPTPQSGSLSSAETISVTVSNNGINTQSNYSLSLYIDNVFQITDNITNNINPGIDYEHTFSGTYDLSSLGTYEIKVALSLTNDADPTNDEFVKTIHSLNVTDIFPYTESFEAGNHGWKSNNLWEHGAPSGITINSASDGTQAWVTDLDGNYTNNAYAILESVWFNFGNLANPRVTFDLNYDIDSYFDSPGGPDGVILAYRTSMEEEFVPVPQYAEVRNWYTGNISSLSHNGWTGYTEDAYVTSSGSLEFLAGEYLVQLAFIFASDTNPVYKEGMAVDNFKIEETPNNDLAIMEIISPNTGFLGANETVRIKVKNVGKQPQSNFDVAYYVNDMSAPVSTETVNMTINPGQTIEYPSNTTFDFSVPGNYVLKVKVILVSDEDITNDELIQNIESLFGYTSFPYSESFEGSIQGWNYTSGWELGTPVGLLVNGTSDGVNALATGLSSNYIDFAGELIESPYFDFSSLLNPVLSIDINYLTQAGFDGAHIEFHELNGSVYRLNNAGISNWYNGYISSAFREGWSGSSEGQYLTAHASLSNIGFSGIGRFKIRFRSDYSINYEGFAVDFFRITEGTPPTDIALSNTDIFHGSSIGTTVGDFSTMDLDETIHSYTLVSGAGGGDNTSFYIENNQLKANEVFDINVKTSYNIRVRSTDGNSNYFEKAFTINVVVPPPLNGTYTIDAVSGNYSSFTEAIDALNMFGVNGPVEFQIANGTYNEQAIMGAITGSSPVNTITFKSASGNREDVVWEFNSTANENYVVKFDGAENITFRDITLQKTTGGANSSVIDMYNAANVTIENVHVVSTNFLTNGLYIFLSDQVTIANSKLSVDSESGSIFVDVSNNINLFNNMISGVGFGINIFQCDNIRVYHNTLQMNSALATFIMYNCNVTDIQNNIISNSDMNGHAYAVDGGTSWSSNYNLVYSSGPTLGVYNSVPIASLQSWRTSTGQGTNSLNQQPYFISDTDLHLGGPQDIFGTVLLDNLGNALLPNDIDSETRGSTDTDPPFIGADEPHFDIGLSNLTANYACDGNALQNIQVTLQNSGGNKISYIPVNLIINGVLQPTVIWQGILSAGQSVAFDMGNYALQLGGNTFELSIPIWGDTNVTNNNLNSTISMGMGDTYTIDKITGDYKNFTEAVNALQNYGICAPVEFVISNDIYKEQIAIPLIEGMGSENLITFRSASGNPSNVVLGIDSSVPGAVVVLNSAHNIAFKNITIYKDGFDDYGNLMYLQNGANSNTFDGVKFEGIFTTVVNSDMDLVVLSGSNTSLNSFTNCTFENGSTGLVINKDGLQSSGNIAENSSFIMQYAGAISIQNNGSATLSGNRIVSDPDGSYVGIKSLDCYGDIKIIGNDINIEQGTGMVITNLYGEEQETYSLIANNIVLAGYSNTSYGIRLNQTENLQLFFNTLVSQSPINTIGAIQVDGITNNLSIMNNILVGFGGAMAYDVTSVASGGIVNSEYNNLYVTTGNLGNWKGNLAGNLAQWQSISGHDLDSYEKNPQFISWGNLHLTNSSPLIGLAFPIPEAVIDDIDGDLRDEINPTIGADEYINSSYRTTESQTSTNNTSTKKQNNHLSDIEIYPNPFSGMLNLKILMAKKGNIIIKITDITGREILYSKEKELLEGNNRVVLDMKNKLRTTGWILVTIAHNNQYNTYKLLYQK